MNQPAQPQSAPNDPTGIRYDRNDLDDAVTRQAGARRRRGFRVTGRSTDAQPVTEPASTPTPAANVRPLPPFNLRELAARRITAAQLHAIERGAA